MVRRLVPFYFFRSFALGTTVGDRRNVGGVATPAVTSTRAAMRTPSSGRVRREALCLARAWFARTIAPRSKALGNLSRKASAFSAVARFLSVGSTDVLHMTTPVRSNVFLRLIHCRTSNPDGPGKFTSSRTNIGFSERRPPAAGQAFRSSALASSAERAVITGFATFARLSNASVSESASMSSSTTRIGRRWGDRFM
jgi:hypothetical protein